MLYEKIKETYDNEQDSAKKVGIAAASVALSPLLAVETGVEKLVEVAPDVIDYLKDENAKYQLKKYNPVFMHDYIKDDFYLPRMIMLVDGSERKDIEVCKGAIGWKSNPNGLEVFHLNCDSANYVNLKFSPAPMCDSVYYVDPHDPAEYICVDNLFEKMQQQKLAELADVAYYLGARSYRIEIVEETREEEIKDFSAEAKAKAKIVESEQNAKHSEQRKKTGRILVSSEAEYLEKREPQEPPLLWFKNDPNITGLVNHICVGGGKIKSKDIYFEGSKYALMNSATAAKIDATVKRLGAGNETDFKTKTEKEYSSKIIFHLEF